MNPLNRRQDKQVHVGIDIGSSKICCAIVETNPANNATKVLGLGSKPFSGMRKGSLIHIDKTIDTLEEVLREAELMANVKVERAVLSLSGEHIRGINTQGAIAVHKSSTQNIPVEHEINAQDVHRVLELSKAISLPMDRDILHVLPQEYIIDTMGSIKDPVGMSGRRLEAKIHLITTATTAAKNIAKCAEELGIQVEGLVFQALSASLPTLTRDEKELGVALVDIGAGTTDITVYHEGGVRHSAVLGIGANSITHDIAMMLQISIEEAEKIKLKYASAKAAMSSTELDFELPAAEGELVRRVTEHELSRYVEARMVEVFQMVAREISRADIHERLTFGVVLTGGGAMLRNIVSLASEVFQEPVRIGTPKGISGVVDVASSPIYATVLGLTQWKTREEEFNPGLLPDKTLNQVWGKLKKWFKEFF
ncbi:MAG: cell division protein FtsA [Candidatus Neomarinimicrobiota bacterium]